MTRKRLIQVLVITVAAVWIFCGIFLFGTLRARKNRPQPALTTAPPLTQSTNADDATTTETPGVTIDGNQFTGDGTTAPTAGTTGSALTPTFATSSPTSGAPVPTQGTTTASVPSGKSAIIAAYLNAVNTLKNTPDFTLVKNETLNVVIDEMTPSSVRSMANKIIESNRKTAPETYVFSGGTDAASGLSPNNVIAPIGQPAAVNESIVKTATATPTAGGGYKIHLEFGRETQTMTTPAPNYSRIFQVLDQASMGLPSAAKVDSFTAVYDNSTVDATIDASGRLTNMTQHIIVVEGEGSGSMVMAVTTKMHGDHTAVYTVTY